MVEELLKNLEKLKSSEHRTRFEAIVNLRNLSEVYSEVMDDEEVKELFETIGELLIDILKNDESIEVKVEAVKILGRIGDVRAVKLLLTEILKEKEGSLFEEAIRALSNILKGDTLDDEKKVVEEVKKDKEIAEKLLEVVQPLIEALKIEDYEIRYSAAKLLGLIGDKRAVEPLIEALKNDNFFTDLVKVRIIKSLAELGDKKAVEALIEALKNDERQSVRKEAAIALGKIGDKRAVLPLIEALKDVSYEVKWGAAVALGMLGDSRAVKPLTEILKKLQNKRLKDDEYNVKKAVTLALEVINKQNQLIQLQP